MDKNQKLPSDRKFLRARAAAKCLAKAIPLLRIASENLSDQDDLIASDACRKAVVKATTAHSRAQELYERERLRVAPQVEMDGVR
ncbi:MAG: hypothetical protein KAX80_15640 [Planctomycetes bacterium]|nr:hypothetical protein [Planctomycetota bacterium]